MLHVVLSGGCFICSSRTSTCSKTTRSVFVEPEAEPDAVPEAEDVVNAQFLMQATFGPTRSSLSQLAGITHEEWVRRQMELPVELHRAYYRPRVNPLSSSEEEVARGPCDAKSRWSQFVFTLADVARASKSWPLAPSLL